jgi:NAD(P)-dependent dehydrogenase (short-subunit alcohol dehydrogenase family)
MRVLVTGANKGIGLGIVAAFAERGDEVYAVCRTTSPELDALGVHVVDGIELTDDAAVAKLSDAVPEQLDVLVCNAGVNNDRPGLELELDRLMYAFDVNTLGTVRVVLTLLPKLGPGSKVLMLSTGGLAALNIKTPSSGNYGYRMSKAALVSFGNGLGRDLKERGVAVTVGAPGTVLTPLLENVFAEGRTTQEVMDRARDIHTAGRMIRDRIDEMSLETSPAWLRSPEGDPAIPADILEQLSG